MTAPLTHSYNLGRLGNAGDRVDFAADADQRAAIAAWSEVLSVQEFAVTADIAKLGPTRFRVAYQLVAAVTQACVVSLEPVPGRIERRFSRELEFVGARRRGASPESGGGDLVLDPGAEEGPEEIENLHYDLAGPVLEEYSMALDPYPRATGAQFVPESPDVQAGEPARQNPFAVLKSLKKPG
ncbi:MAG: hypothetical protein H6924_03130 [Alphaproteobacteria bacterium]|nr:hypothetical protein [Alphaproteobacteria bacterium]